MPNYVTNVLVFTADEQKKIDELIQFVKKEGEPDGSFDFNKIIPVPKELKIDASLSNDWCRKNWGTKWNSTTWDRKRYMNNPFPKYAVDICNASNYFSRTRFDTAWNPAFPVYKKLSRMFPDVLIHVLYAEEQLGIMTGARTYKNGWVVFDTPYKDHSKEAYEFSAQILGYDLAENGYVYDETEGTYVYKPELDTEV